MAKIAYGFLNRKRGKNNKKSRYKIFIDDWRACRNRAPLIVSWYLPPLAWSCCWTEEFMQLQLHPKYTKEHNRRSFLPADVKFYNHHRFQQIQSLHPCRYFLQGYFFHFQSHSCCHLYIPVVCIVFSYFFKCSVIFMHIYTCIFFFL